MKNSSPAGNLSEKSLLKTLATLLFYGKTKNPPLAAGQLAPNNNTPFLGAYRPGDEAKAFSKLDYEFIRRTFKLLNLVEKYFHFEIIDINKPPSGPCLYVVNHTFTTIEPWFGMFNRYVATGEWKISGLLDMHWFKFPVIRDIFIKTGNIRPEKDTIVDTLKRGNQVGIMLGGTTEAYKPSSERYKIYWYNKDGTPKWGFIKIALECQAPIVPLAYVGSEEIFYVSKFKTDFFIRSKLINYQMPYVIFKPLPYKIYEVWGEPIYFDYPPSAAEDEAILTKCFEEVKAKFLANMQRGFDLKEANAKKWARRLFKSENPRLVNFIKPYC